MEADEAPVLALSLRAWTPVFASFRAVLGDSIYELIYPDWQRHQSDAVRGDLGS